jgi:hypothetical protein
MGVNVLQLLARMLAGTVMVTVSFDHLLCIIKNSPHEEKITVGELNVRTMHCEVSYRLMK